MLPELLAAAVRASLTAHEALLRGDTTTTSETFRSDSQRKKEHIRSELNHMQCTFIKLLPAACLGRQRVFSPIKMISDGFKLAAVRFCDSEEVSQVCWNTTELRQTASWSALGPRPPEPRHRPSGPTDGHDREKMCLLKSLRNKSCNEHVGSDFLASSDC